MSDYKDIQALLQQKADLQARLNLLPYDGTPEVKTRDDHKYLYVRKRVAGKQTSEYVDVYSDELYQMLLRTAREARALKKELRHIEKALAALDYTQADLPPAVQRNLDFARANMKVSIYEQAVLEGVATTFPQTEDIIDNGKVNGVTASDVQKILNLKHAWEFILDADVLNYPTDYSILCHIAQLVNEGFFVNGGRLRGVPVAIGGSTYRPPIPQEADVKAALTALLQQDTAPISIAIALCLYVMKAQLFNDGNKRTAVLFANHYLIANAGGLLVIPEDQVPAFKQLLVMYYEDRDDGALPVFLKEHCWRSCGM